MNLEGILAIIFGITTLIGIVVTIKLAKRKQPAWAHKTRKIIGLGTEAPQELKLTFNGKSINDVYRTIFIFFNKGNEAIQSNDVPQKVSINFGGAEILREPVIKGKSDESIGFSAQRVVTEENDSIELDFSYLDHDDGI